MNRLFISLLTLGSLAALQASPISYTVTVDSSSIGATTPGFIEFQFNQANSITSLAATASVSNFTSSGFTFDNTTDYSLGGVSGSLSSPPLVFDNTIGGSNLYDQGVSLFGSSFSFTLTLDGAALATPSSDGSEFFVYLLGTGPDYNNLAGPGSGVANVIINGDTTITTAPVAGFSTIAPYVPDMSGAPEPSPLSLLGLGCVALFIALRRRSTLLARRSGQLL